MKKAKRQESPNRWGRDADKQEYWRYQIRMWQGSGLSVRAFCKEQGVVETSFYAWRRELLIRAREGLDSTLEGLSPDTVKDSSEETNRTRFRQTDHAALQTLLDPKPPENPFVRLSLVSNDERSAQCQPPEAPKSELTITTPSGYRIAVRSVDDIELLKRVVISLEENKC